MTRPGNYREPQHPRRAQAQLSNKRLEINWHGRVAVHRRMQSVPRHHGRGWDSVMGSLPDQGRAGVGVAVRRGSSLHERARLVLNDAERRRFGPLASHRAHTQVVSRLLPFRRKTRRSKISHLPASEKAHVCELSSRSPQGNLVAGVRRLQQCARGPSIKAGRQVTTSALACWTKRSHSLAVGGEGDGATPCGLAGTGAGSVFVVVVAQVRRSSTTRLVIDYQYATPQLGSARGR